MPSVYAGTDIISCLRSKYIMRRQLYITSRQRYIIKNFSEGCESVSLKTQIHLFCSPCKKSLSHKWAGFLFFISYLFIFEIAYR